MRNGYLIPAFSRPDKRTEVQVTPAFLAVPNKRDKERDGYLTLVLSVAHQRAQLMGNTCILRRPQQGDKIRTPRLLRCPQKGRIAG